LRRFDDALHDSPVRFAPKLGPDYTRPRKINGVYFMLVSLLCRTYAFIPRAAGCSWDHIQ